MFVIYHSMCADGFGAAYAVWRAHPEATFFPGVYQQSPPDVAGQDVVFVDFCYKRDVMLNLAKTARSVLVLDHHKSAAEDMQRMHDINGDSIERFDDWHGQLTWERHLGNVLMDYNEGAPHARIYAYFDMERSGAGIAWDFFNPSRLRPRLIDHIEDRDLWRFKYPQTRNIQAALFSFPYNFEVWHALMSSDLNVLDNEGRGIERKHHKDIAELVAVCKRRMKIAGIEVWVASLPYTLTSDAGHLMSDEGTYAVCYWDTATQRVFSLRSRDGGTDVSEIAKVYGGGGHKNAAGFAVPREHELARA
jgi:uncharacterized protein